MCEEGQFYCRFHFNVGSGLHTAVARIVLPDGSTHASTATRLFRVQTEEQAAQAKTEAAWEAVAARLTAT